MLVICHRCPFFLQSFYYCLFCLNISGDLVTRLQAEELTKDHHPDRDDEKARIEAAGGVVRIVGVLVSMVYWLSHGLLVTLV